MSQPPLFKSARGRRLILDAGDRNLRNIRQPWSTREVSTRWGPTWVLEAGPRDAPPLLFLHGIATHSPAYDHEINSLSTRFRVFAPDIPGQPGRSVERTLPFRGQAYGEWATDLLDALGLEAVHVAGFSMGGYATLVLVAEHDCFWHAGETLVGAHRLLARPTVELLRGQGHVPVAAHREANATRALSFLAEA
jgi:pimeloyl-ACP methyl ester carboxylesterase